MLEIFAPIVPEIASYVIKELASIGLTKLKEKILNPTSDEPTPKVEIKEPEIRAKIEETLLKRDDIDDIKNNNEKMTELIQQVLSEVQTISEQLSKQDPNWKVEPDEIILSKPEEITDDPEQTKNWLEIFKKFVDEIADKKRTEIEADVTASEPWIDESQTEPSSDDDDDISPQPTPKPSQPQKPSNNNGNRVSSPRVKNTEVPSAENPESKMSDNLQLQPSPSEAPSHNARNQVSPSEVKKREVRVLENPESTMLLENLHKYQEYGDSVQRVLKSLEKYQSSQNEILDDSQLKDCLKSLQDAANKTVELATSPVKIAVMGEFSSGKTLLIGSLIGYADALPVSEIATTGNVTAIHLLQQEDFKTTEFDDFLVEYLSHAEVQECLNFMLDQAKQRARPSELPPFPQVTSNSLNENTLNLYEEWCESAWNQTQNPDLRYLLRELVIFIRGYASYGAYLCGKSLKINHTNAREGLRLTSTAPVNQESQFQEIPSVVRVSVNKISQELLQNSFSLIRRVNITVKISKEIWNLGTTQDTSKFTILDFPGLGAADSGVRDTFVSLLELAEVQTILILLDGKKPGGDRATRIFNMIKEKRPEQKLKNFILVGVGRFNQLPIDSELKFDRLIHSSANKPLTKTTVFQEFNVLETIIAQASALTSPRDRIVLLDQQIALADLENVFPSAVKVGSPEFLARLEDPNDSSLQQSKRMRKNWKSLSDHLLQTDPHSPLGKQLYYFAQDGGIGKLRELLLNHLAEHSLEQLYDDTKKIAQTLRQEQDRLESILSQLGITTEESTDLMQLRDAIEQIYRTYNRFKDNLGKEPLKDAGGVAINDVIKDEVTYRTLEWSQWNLLFSRSQNGIIVLPQPDNDDLFEGLEEQTDSIPTKSDDFYDVFDKTVKRLQEFARNSIQEAISNLLNQWQWSEELDPQIKFLNEIFTEAIKTDIKDKENFREKFVIFNNVYELYQPIKWQDRIQKTVFKSDKSIETASIFPLANKNEKHDNGQIFDWAAESKKINLQTANQVLLVQRLRDEITASISLHIIEYVSQINKEVDNAILRILDRLTAQLDKLRGEEALLRYIAGEEQTINEADPVSPILSQMASISLPDISS